MKAMILAAGRGERMKPLSDKLPKPLLKVKNKPLIVWHIEKLSQNGFKEIIINTAHLAHKITEYLGDGTKWGVNIIYSDEQKSGALESAGGIKKALKILGDEPFLVVNGDIFSDYEFNSSFDLKDKLAHLILVPNPPHNQDGDFALNNALVLNQDKIMYTFSGIAYYHPSFFKDVKLQKSPIAPILRKAVKNEQVIGTPQRLREIND